MDAAGLSLNKRVKIENRRLRTLYRTTMLLTAGSLIFKFLFLSEYKRVVPLEFVRPWVWVDPTHGSAGDTMALWRTNCSRPKTPLGQCVFPCPHSQRSCHHQWALYTQESDNAVLFHSKTETWRANSSNSTTALLSELLYPYATNFKISLGYAYKRDNKHICSSTTNVRTKVRKNRQEVSTLEPGSQISFSITELLNLAGHPGIFHEVGAAHTGIELQLKLSCDVHLDASMCTFDVDVTPQQWVFSAKFRMHDNGLLEHSTDYGIRVSVVAEGHHSTPDFEKTWASIVAALVLLGLPKQAIHAFVTRWLGHLSKIYRKVLTEPFDLSEQLGGMAVRLMSNSVIFLQLQDAGEGIVAERMRERMHQVFVDIQHKLDDREIDNFTNFCFGAAVRRDDEGHTWWQKVRSSLAIDDGDGTQLDEDSGNRKLNSTKFSEACASNESIGFQDVVDLFDGDRARGYLERMFTPYDIKSYVNATKISAAKRRLDASASRSATSPLGFVGDKRHRESVNSNINNLSSLISNLETRLADLEQRAFEHEKRITALGSDASESTATFTQMVGQISQLQHAANKEEKEKERAQDQALEALQSQVETLGTSLGNMRDEAWHTSQTRLDILDGKISELASHLMLFLKNISASRLDVDSVHACPQLVTNTLENMPNSTKPSQQSQYGTGDNGVGLVVAI